VLRYFDIIRNGLDYFGENGPKTGLKYSLHWLYEHFEERRLGVRTLGYHWLSDLGVSKTGYNDYVAIDYRSLWRVLRRLKVYQERDVFLDIGSGMGRVVVSAATFPFKKVIGVEISADLCDIAVGNLNGSIKHRKCGEVEIINTDIFDYDDFDQINYFFMYNPFNQDLLDTVLERIRVSWRDCPRKVTILYRPPRQGHVDFPGGLTWIEPAFSIWSYSGRPLTVYETVGANRR
jgi:hypothetical protein